VEEINERILKMIIKVHSAEFVIISVYGPNEDATDGEKGDFYVHIRDISRKIRSEQKLIITGDLNGKVKSKIKTEGENEQNDNGYRIVELCRFADLNTLFNINKFMFIHGDSTLKN